MRAHLNPLLAAVVCGLATLLIVCSMSVPANAVEIWNGPTTTFIEPPGANWTQPANQDRLTPNVWITRNLVQGLFNAKTESAYTHNSSPAGTEWAYGNLSDYASLPYTAWEIMFGGRFGGGPSSTVGKNAVCHLLADDIYFSVKFTSWGGSSGGFSYVRSTPSVPEPSVGVMMFSALGVLWGFRRGRVRS